MKKMSFLVIIFMMVFTSLAAPTNFAAERAENNDDWLYAEGNKIYDQYGNEVYLTGANWFGFNCSENVFHGSWYDVKEILTDVANRGINILRIPISTELLYSWMTGEPNPVSSVTAVEGSEYEEAVNPDFYDPAIDDVKNSMEIFDIIMGYCRELGIKVMIDVHSPHADNSGHMYSLWYGVGTDTAGIITTDMWIDTLVWLADKYKNDDTILAIDIQNEPHGERGFSGPVPDDMAIWNNSMLENNWKYAAERCAEAILNVNPNLLIIIEGIQQYPNTDAGYTYDDPDVWGESGIYHNAWWGGNLRGVRDYPVDLGPLNSQIVYSPHDYGPLVHQQPWFDKDFSRQTLLDDYWYDTWAYIHEEEIAPLFFGEWGGHMDGGDNQKWMEIFRDYMIEKGMHHTFWCINPNSGDTGGLLGNDWSTWDEEKYSLLKKALWQDSSGRFIGLDHRVPLGENGITISEYYGQTPPSNDPPNDPPGGDVIMGDLNEDEEVNSLDYILMRRNLLGFSVEISFEAADLNEDGALNSLDYILLRRMLLDND